MLTNEAESDRSAAVSQCSNQLPAASLGDKREIEVKLNNREIVQSAVRQWMIRRSRMEIIGPRIGVALALPFGVAFYSYWLAALVAVPSWYVAMSQARYWKQLSDDDRHGFSRRAR